jgi:Uma2 family endonuclease
MTTAPPAEQTTPVYEPRLWRFTVEQYHQMGAAGVLNEDDSVELLEGYLIEKPMKNAPHSFSTRRLYKALERTAPAGWLVISQEPITTSDSEPEPDVSVVRGDENSYAERHPQSGEIALVAEVSDTTLRQDRTTKLRIYARARIPTYWILNLPERTLEVYTEPSGDEYRQRRTYVETDTVPVILDGQEVGQLAVAELLS